MKGKQEVNNGNGDELLNKFNIIEKIAKMLTKYGYKKIISSFVIFVLFIGTIIVFTNQKTILDKIINEQKKEQRKEEVNKINFRINEVNPRVDAILYKLLAQTKADRAFVIEMHNGTDNPTGLPFVFGDMTYERIANDSIESVIYQYEKINLSTLPIATYLIKNKKFIGSMDDLKKIDSRISKKMSSNGAEYVAIYGLRTINSEIGWVGITYCNKTTEHISNIEANMLDASQTLSILLDITDNIKEN